MARVYAPTPISEWLQQMKADNRYVGINEAKEHGDIVYYTGKPCRNGHVDFRYIKNSMCLSCAKKMNDDRPRKADVLAEEVEKPVKLTRVEKKEIAITTRQKRNRLEERLEIARIEREHDLNYD